MVMGLHWSVSIISIVTMSPEVIINKSLMKCSMKILLMFSGNMFQYYA